MTNSFQAQNGYKTTQRELTSDKDIEYKVLASVTAALSRIDMDEIGAQTKLAEALIDNVKLWNIFFLDLVNPNNTLPLPLKTNLISLAEFTQAHTLKVFKGEADHKVLIDINQSIASGLRQAMSIANAAETNQEEAA